MGELEEHEFTFGPTGSKKTFYNASGPVHGPLIIFIHGWPAIGRLWEPQLTTFASLGFRAVAPDMPGYGKSSATKKVEEYAQKNINMGMIALLDHLDREKAVWIAHDWGCGAVWTFAAHYPERCIAVAGLTVPYGTIEYGLEELVKTVNRDIYPKDEYPFGQWAYMKYYETSFEDATSWFDADIPAVVRLLYSKGDPSSYGKRAFTAEVVKDGGWFGGKPHPDPKWNQTPLSNTVFNSERIYEDVVNAMKKTGFWGADAWYSNHARNRIYTLETRKNDGYLHMPVLFIEAKFDPVCDTSLSSLGDAMRKYCHDLTECSIDSGHWVAEEKPAEVNAAITKWLVERVKGFWPSSSKHGAI